MGLKSAIKNIKKNIGKNKKKNKGKNTETKQKAKKNNTKKTTSNKSGSNGSKKTNTRKASNNTKKSTKNNKAKNKQNKGSKQSKKKNSNKKNNPKKQLNSALKRGFKSGGNKGKGKGKSNKGKKKKQNTNAKIVPIKTNNIYTPMRHKTSKNGARSATQASYVNGFYVPRPHDADISRSKINTTTTKVNRTTPPKNNNNSSQKKSNKTGGFLTSLKDIFCPTCYAGEIPSSQNQNKNGNNKPKKSNINLQREFNNTISGNFKTGANPWAKSSTEAARHNNTGAMQSLNIVAKANQGNTQAQKMIDNYANNQSKNKNSDKGNSKGKKKKNQVLKDAAKMYGGQEVSFVKSYQNEGKALEREYNNLQRKGSRVTEAELNAFNERVNKYNSGAQRYQSALNRSAIYYDAGLLSKSDRKALKPTIKKIQTENEQYAINQWLGASQDRRRLEEQKSVARNKYQEAKAKDPNSEETKRARQEYKAAKNALSQKGLQANGIDLNETIKNGFKTNKNSTSNNPPRIETIDEKNARRASNVFYTDRANFYMQQANNIWTEQPKLEVKKGGGKKQNNSSKGVNQSEKKGKGAVATAKNNKSKSKGLLNSVVKTGAKVTSKIAPVFAYFGQYSVDPNDANYRTNGLGDTKSYKDLKINYDNWYKKQEEKGNFAGRFGNAVKMNLYEIGDAAVTAGAKATSKIKPVLNIAGKGIGNIFLKSAAAQADGMYGTNGYENVKTYDINYKNEQIKSEKKYQDFLSDAEGKSVGYKTKRTGNSIKLFGEEAGAAFLDVGGSLKNAGASALEWLAEGQIHDGEQYYYGKNSNYHYITAEEEEKIIKKMRKDVKESILNTNWGDDLIRNTNSYQKAYQRAYAKDTVVTLGNLVGDSVPKLLMYSNPYTAWLIGASAYGRGVQKAYKEGADYKDAQFYGLTSGALEQVMWRAGKATRMIQGGKYVKSATQKGLLGNAKIVRLSDLNHLTSDEVAALSGKELFTLGTKTAAAGRVTSDSMQGLAFTPLDAVLEASTYKGKGRTYYTYDENGQMVAVKVGDDASFSSRFKTAYEELGGTKAAITGALMSGGLSGLSEAGPLAKSINAMRQGKSPFNADVKPSGLPLNETSSKLNTIMSKLGEGESNPVTSLMNRFARDASILDTKQVRKMLEKELKSRGLKDEASALKDVSDNTILTKLMENTDFRNKYLMESVKNDFRVSENAIGTDATIKLLNDTIKNFDDANSPFTKKDLESVAREVTENKITTKEYNDSVSTIRKIKDSVNESKDTSFDELIENVKKSLGDDITDESKVKKIFIEEAQKHIDNDELISKVSGIKEAALSQILLSENKSFKDSVYEVYAKNFDVSEKTGANAIKKSLVPGIVKIYSLPHLIKFFIGNSKSDSRVNIVDFDSLKKLKQTADYKNVKASATEKVRAIYDYLNEKTNNLPSDITNEEVLICDMLSGKSRNYHSIPKHVKSNNAFNSYYSHLYKDFYLTGRDIELIDKNRVFADATMDYLIKNSGANLLERIKMMQNKSHTNNALNSYIYLKNYGMKFYKDSLIKRNLDGILDSSKIDKILESIVFTNNIEKTRLKSIFGGIAGYNYSKGHIIAINLLGASKGISTLIHEINHANGGFERTGIEENVTEVLTRLFLGSKTTSGGYETTVAQFFRLLEEGVVSINSLFDAYYTNNLDVLHKEFSASFTEQNSKKLITKFIDLLDDSTGKDFAPLKEIQLDYTISKMIREYKKNVSENIRKARKEKYARDLLEFKDTAKRIQEEVSPILEKERLSILGENIKKYSGESALAGYIDNNVYSKTGAEISSKKLKPSKIQARSNVKKEQITTKTSNKSVISDESIIAAKKELLTAIETNPLDNVQALESILRKFTEDSGSKQGFYKKEFAKSLDDSMYDALTGRSIISKADRINKESVQKAYDKLLSTIKSDDLVYTKDRGSHWMLFESKRGKNTGSEYKYYLQIPDERAYKFAELFYKTAKDNDLDVYFKVQKPDKLRSLSRKDNIVIYSSEENLSSYLAILNKILKENKDISQSAVTLEDALFTRVNDKVGLATDSYMPHDLDDGFMHEVASDDLSYNETRAKVLNEALTSLFDSKKYSGFVQESMSKTINNILSSNMKNEFLNDFSKAAKDKIKNISSINSSEVNGVFSDEQISFISKFKNDIDEYVAKQTSDDAVVYHGKTRAEIKDLFNEENQNGKMNKTTEMTSEVIGEKAGEFKVVKEIDKNNNTIYNIYLIKTGKFGRVSKKYLDNFLAKHGGMDKPEVPTSTKIINSEIGRIKRITRGDKVFYYDNSDKLIFEENLDFIARENPKTLNNKKVTETVVPEKVKTPEKITAQDLLQKTKQKDKYYRTLLSKLGTMNYKVENAAKSLYGIYESLEGKFGREKALDILQKTIKERSSKYLDKSFAEEFDSISKEHFSEIVNPVIETIRTNIKENASNSETLIRKIDSWLKQENTKVEDDEITSIPGIDFISQKTRQQSDLIEKTTVKNYTAEAQKLISNISYEPLKNLAVLEGILRRYIKNIPDDSITNKMYRAVSGNTPRVNKFNENLLNSNFDSLKSQARENGFKTWTNKAKYFQFFQQNGTPKAEMKLYLNIDNENCYKMAAKLAEVIHSDCPDEPVQFKVMRPNKFQAHKRLESIVIYASKDNVDRLVGSVLRTFDENPELEKSVSKMEGGLMTNVHPKIGIASESKSKNHSYNSLRAKVLESSLLEIINSDKYAPLFGENAKYTSVIKKLETILNSRQKDEFLHDLSDSTYKSLIKNEGATASEKCSAISVAHEHLLENANTGAKSASSVNSATQNIVKMIPNKNASTTKKATSNLSNSLKSEQKVDLSSLESFKKALYDAKVIGVKSSSGPLDGITKQIKEVDVLINGEKYHYKNIISDGKIESSTYYKVENNGNLTELFNESSKISTSADKTKVANPKPKTKQNKDYYTVLSNELNTINYKVENDAKSLYGIYESLEGKFGREKALDMMLKSIKERTSNHLDDSSAKEFDSISKEHFSEIVNPVIETIRTNIEENASNSETLIKKIDSWLKQENTKVEDDEIVSIPGFEFEGSKTKSQSNLDVQKNNNSGTSTTFNTQTKKQIIFDYDKLKFMEFLEKDADGKILRLLDDEGIEFLSNAKNKNERINYIMTFSKFVNDLIKNNDFADMIIDSVESSKLDQLEMLNYESCAFLLDKYSQKGLNSSKLFNAFSSENQLKILDNWKYSDKLLYNILDYGDSAIKQKIFENFNIDLSKIKELDLFFESCKKYAANLEDKSLKNHVDIKMPSRLIDSSVAETIWNNYNIFKIREMINNASYFTDVSYLNSFIKRKQYNFIMDVARSGTTLVEPYSRLFTLFRDLNDKKLDLDSKTYIKLENEYYGILNRLDEEGLKSNLNSIYRNEGIDGVRNFIEMISNRTLSNNIIDYLFEDNYHNVIINIKQLLKFNESGSISLSKEKVKVYEKICNIDSLSFKERIELFNSLKDKNTVELLYDDMKEARTVIGKLIKEKSINSDSINSYLDEELTKKYGVNVYVPNDKKFYGLVKVLGVYNKGSDKLPTGHSYSLVGSEHTNTWDSTGDNKVTYLYDSNSLNPEQIVHVFPTDSYSLYKPFSEISNASERVNVLMTPEELLKNTQVYNEIIMLEKGSQKTPVDSGIPELKKLAVYCLDEIKPKDIETAKEQGLGIFLTEKVNSNNTNNYFDHNYYSPFAHKKFEGQRTSEVPKEQVEFDNTVSPIKKDSTPVSKSDESVSLESEDKKVASENTISNQNKIKIKAEEEKTKQNQESSIKDNEHEARENSKVDDEIVSIPGFEFEGSKTKSQSNNIDETGSAPKVHNEPEKTSDTNQAKNDSIHPSKPAESTLLDLETKKLATENVTSEPKIDKSNNQKMQNTDEKKVKTSVKKIKKPKTTSKKTNSSDIDALLTEAKTNSTNKMISSKDNAIYEIGHKKLITKEKLKRLFDKQKIDSKDKLVVYSELIKEIPEKLEIWKTSIGGEITYRVLDKKTGKSRDLSETGYKQYIRKKNVYFRRKLSAPKKKCTIQKINNITRIINDDIVTYKRQDKILFQEKIVPIKENITNTQNESKSKTGEVKVKQNQDSILTESSPDAVPLRKYNHLKKTLKNSTFKKTNGKIIKFENENSKNNSSQNENFNYKVKNLLKNYLESVDLHDAETIKKIGYAAGIASLSGLALNNPFRLNNAGTPHYESAEKVNLNQNINNVVSQGDYEFIETLNNEEKVVTSSSNNKNQNEAVFKVAEDNHNSRSTEEGITKINDSSYSGSSNFKSETSYNKSIRSNNGVNLNNTNISSYTQINKVTNTIQNNILYNKNNLINLIKEYMSSKQIDASLESILSIEDQSLKNYIKMIILNALEKIDFSSYNQVNEEIIKMVEDYIKKNLEIINI